VRRVLILLALTALSLGSADSARASEAGLVTDLTWGATAAEQDRTVTAIRDSGASWVRLSIQWKNIEQAVPGVYDVWWLNHVDHGVALADAAGLKVLMMVYDAPPWASGSSSRTTPRSPADFAAFMRFVATRWADKIDAYEIWNEQNIARFWTSPNAADYTRLLQAAYPVVKAADPTATVLFGGLSTSDYAYIEAAYAAGARGSFDAMAVHPYTYCGTGSPDELRRNADGRITRDSFLGYREVRASMLARGDDKPIWITEFGWNTSTVGCDPGRGFWQGGVSEAAQAAHLTRAYALFATEPYLGPAFTYNLRNNYWERDANTAEARYGLMRTDFSPKPSFEAFRAAAGIPPTPVPPPLPPPGPVPPPVPPPGPTVELTSPTDGSATRGSLTFSATARDAVRVSFYVDGALVKTDTSAPYTFKWGNFKRLAVGPHKAEARAFDASGRVGSDSATVTRLP
jgi:hypothetical protein